jgi:putative antitoxin of VapBC-like toxin-antitoxin system
MKLHLDLDETLVRTARELAGVEDTQALVEAGLRLLIERAAGNRLAKLGGSQPDFKPPRRRRPSPHRSGKRS